MKAAVGSYKNVWTSVGFGLCAKGIHVKGSRNNTAQEKGDMGKRTINWAPNSWPTHYCEVSATQAMESTMFLCPTSSLMCQSVVAVADVARPWLAHKERWVKGVGPVCMCGCKLCVCVYCTWVCTILLSGCLLYKCKNMRVCTYVHFVKPHAVPLSCVSGQMPAHWGVWSSLLVPSGMLFTKFTFVHVV